ncbi:MAG: 50S ribosomal protein L2 [Methanocellales archaeon]|nr:50S ribosomal protein L2 [Methanocellales archaeon]MDD3421096.1 50S ribosomal protein L2 [Methanocellales archaeon]MDD4898199.1 50S ribosomal protein L2 [Methanocellales archaeon]MDD5446696.1 50S ribosomal protein L2 [Methanocellales archaeon]
MGKQLISQNRGRGTPTYRAPSHKYKADLQHVKTDEGETVKGTIIGIEHDPARSAPIARVRFDNDTERFLLIPEGVAVGDDIACGISAEIKQGNTLPLAEIPEGVPICNIESRPGNGGSFARSSGVYGILVAHDVHQTVVQLPSGETKWLSPRCKATIGVVAGGGRIDKPFVKAGKKYHKMKARAGKYPRVRGVAMNVIDHPFGGGGSQHPGRPKTVGRGAPPGMKVGSIAARRTGKR